MSNRKVMIIHLIFGLIKKFENYGKELQKAKQKEFRIEKYLKEKTINYMSNGKVMIIHLILGLIKKIEYYGKELQKAKQKEFRIEKVIKTNDNKLHVKWKSYDNSFNTWIDKSDLVLRKITQKKL